MASYPASYQYGQRGIYGPNGADHGFTSGIVPLMLSAPGSAVEPFSSGWNTQGVTISGNLYNSQSGTAMSSKQQEVQDLLNYMGRGTTYYSQNFHIRRLTYSSGREGQYMGPWHTMHNFYNGGCTSAAFVRLESGSAPTGHWMSGFDSSNSGWQLVGTYYSGGTTGYTHNHPHGASGNSSCSLLVALPATVQGYVDLSNPRNWWMFPHVNSYSGKG